MTKLILLTFLNLLAIANTFSQNPTPTTKPVEIKDDDIVKISTTLIQIDVSVTDKDGKAVTNLTPEDFEVYENGKKQKITNFSFISSIKSESKLIDDSKTTKGEVANLLPPSQIKFSQVKRTIALVVDDLGLSFESVNQVKEALRKFVDEQMQPNDLVAILRTGGGIGALQQFTSDKKLLHLSIASISWNALGRGGISKTPEIDVSDAESSQNNTTSNAARNSKSIISDSQMAEDSAEQADQLRFFKDDHLASGTMGAIGFIIKGMENLPGKKSIMLFSEGFTICDPIDIGRCSRMTAEAKKLTAIANRSAITIYAQDSTGLVYTGLTASNNVTVRDVQTVQHALDKRAMELAQRRDGLFFFGKRNRRTSNF